MLRIVFQNLLINGAHAMHGRARSASRWPARDGACEIAFSDAGPGIPADIREKIFMPFFTTKSRGLRARTADGQAPRRSPQRPDLNRLPACRGTTVVVRLPLDAEPSEACRGRLASVVAQPA